MRRKSSLHLLHRRQTKSRAASLRAMRKSLKDKKTVAKNVAKALAEVPIDNKQERDALRARLRRKYGELKRLRTGMREDDRKRFDEIGEIIDEMDKNESRAGLRRN
jgi:hypothetical protein